MNNKDNCDILYKIEFDPARMCLDSNPNSARVPIPCIIISLKTSDNSEKSISAYDLGFSSVSPKDSESKIEQVNKLDFNIINLEKVRQKKWQMLKRHTKQLDQFM